MKFDSAKISVWRTHMFRALLTIGSVSAVGALSFVAVLYSACVFPEQFGTLLSSITKNACTLPIFQITKEDVLGATSKPSLDRITIEKKRDYWKYVTEAHPDYEDAYVQIIILSYQLENNDDVTTYLSLLKVRNPNHTLLKTLEALVEKK